MGSGSDKASLVCSIVLVHASAQASLSTASALVYLAALPWLCPVDEYGCKNTPCLILMEADNLAAGPVPPKRLRWHHCWTSGKNLLLRDFAKYSTWADKKKNKHPFCHGGERWGWVGVLRSRTMNLYMITWNFWNWAKKIQRKHPLDSEFLLGETVSSTLRSVPDIKSA